MGRNRSTLSAITKAQTLVLIAALMLSALLLAYTAASHGNAKAIEEKREGIVDIPLHNTLVITVQRTTGETEKYVKQGDPWTQNLIALIANLMLGRGYSSPLAIYKTDGSNFNYIETAYLVVGSSGAVAPDPMLAIQIGQSDYPFSPSQYSLVSPIATFNVTSSGVSVSDDGITITATFTSSWTASSDVTVREVGLILEVCTFGTKTYSYVLLARDVLSTPVSLASGDAISVSYQVSFTYGQPPFLKNFAAILFNYIFGLKYYGQARTINTMDGASVSIDYGIDYVSVTTPYDNIKEPASLIYDGADVAFYFPGKSSISTIAMRVDNVMLSVQVVNSTHAKISYSSATVLLSPSTVSAIGLSFKTDTDTAGANNFKDILILYFPLDNPLYAPAGSSIRFMFTIWLRLVPS
jgi:hypothetical protein